MSDLLKLSVDVLLLLVITEHLDVRSFVRFCSVHAFQFLSIMNIPREPPM